MSICWAEVCRVGNFIILGSREAETAIAKGSLVSRFLLRQDHPRGTTVRTMTEEEFLQREGGQLCIYRRGDHDDFHVVCLVDLCGKSDARSGRGS